MHDPNITNCECLNRGPFGSESRVHFEWWKMMERVSVLVLEESMQAKCNSFTRDFSMYLEGRMRIKTLCKGMRLRLSRAECKVDDSRAHVKTVGKAYTRLQT